MITRRTALQALAVAAFAGRGLVTEAAAQMGQRKEPVAAAKGKFELPALPYAHDALEPHIDAQTMELHHGRHHQAYVNNLNAALEKHPALAGKRLEELIAGLDQVPEDIRTQVRNNGGGHLNHSIFWRLMSPKGGGEPRGPIARIIEKSFGGFDSFKKQFQSAGTGVFGSGWVWLVRTQDGAARIVTTPNQDSPIAQGEFPLLGNDVWEHAYYLRYQNRRGDYLSAWWNVVDWDEVNRRLQGAQED